MLSDEITPSIEEFRELAKTRRVIPVYRRLLQDELTTVGLYRALGNGEAGSFLFESAEQGRSWSRYSFVGARAAAVLSDEGGRGAWFGRKPAGLRGDGEFVELLREALDFLHTPRDENLPPFTGGLVGYLGFDAVRHVEKLPRPPKHQPVTPDAVFWLVTDIAVLDHNDACVTLIANAINFDGTDAGVDVAWQEAVQRVENMSSRLQQPTAPVVPTQVSTHSAEALTPRRSTSPERYQDAVSQAKRFIHAGDAFQIVLSQGYELPPPTDSLDIYRALRATNPSPYLYFLRVPSGVLGKTLFDIAGSSPEALLTVKDGQLMMHPIAGTRPRGEGVEHDERLERELLADAKERAEHLMLVDLGRNDLARVSTPGSVEVAQFMQVERYSHVMHLVSTLRARLAAGLNALDAVLATFPAGTLSGAPKIRAIEIIDELEDSPRGVYGGAVGYFDFAGNADMAIAIRTAVVFEDRVIVQAGAGVVADSSPELEDAECQAKAQAVISAIVRAHSMSQHPAAEKT